MRERENLTCGFTTTWDVLIPLTSQTKSFIEAHSFNVRLSATRTG